jgi:cytidine deaminase
MKLLHSKPRKLYQLTDDECKKLMDAGAKAIVNTYPESASGYAVAVLTEQGNMYQGVSYGSDTQSLTMHSEATALAHAAIHGEKNVVAITGPNCHICKQLIWESSLKSGIEMVIVMHENGEIKQIPISTLMPYPWPDSARMAMSGKPDDEGRH